MKKLILFILLFAWAGVSSGACPGGICYFAPSAVGSGNCADAANACTLATALSTATTNDDLLGVNGTSSTSAGTSFFNWPNVAGVSIDCVNPHQCIIAAGAGGSTTRVIHSLQPTSGAGPHFKHVTIDGNGIATNCLTINPSSGNIQSITCDGCKLIGSTGTWIDDGGETLAITLSGDWEAESTATGTFDGFYVKGSVSGTPTLTVGPGTITQSGIGAVVNTSFTIVPTNSGLTANITGPITINKTASNANATLRGIFSYGASTITADNINCSYTGATGSGNSSCVQVAINAISSIATLSNITGNIGNTSSSYGIFIGSDSDTQPTNHDTITAIVRDSNILNANHGIFFGWVTDGKAYNNTVTNSLIGLIGKGTTNFLDYHNIVNGTTTGGAFRSKNSTNDKHYNNTFISTGNGSFCEYASNSTAGTVPSTGIEYKNNICSFGSYSGAFTFVSADGGGGASEATFSNNGYYTTNTPTGYWSYQGTAYNSLALWQAASHDSAAFFADPLLDPTTHRPLPSSPAINAGTDVCATLVNATDFAGKTVCASSTAVETWKNGAEIGAYGFFHNLTPNLLRMFYRYKNIITSAESIMDFYPMDEGGNYPVDESGNYPTDGGS